MNQSLCLYHYYRSSCSWRVRWALELKGVACRLVPVNLLAGEHKQAWYLAKNPMGQVPCLETAQGSFSESMAILEWLEETYPQPALLPQDGFSRMRVRSLCQIIISGTQPLQNLAAQRFFSPDRSEQVRYVRHWINLGLAAYEQAVQSSAGTFSFGGQLTLADLCLVPQCYNAERFDVNVGQFPTVERIYRRCREEPSCRATEPERYT